MEETRYLTLAEAVRLALERGGGEALARPGLMLGFLMDFLDPRSPELRALERNMDAGLLAPFREELARPEPDLRAAAARANSYLTDECVVDEEAARCVADGIAEGVARWRGVGCEREGQVSAEPPVGQAARGGWEAPPGADRPGAKAGAPQGAGVAGEGNGEMGAADKTPAARRRPLALVAACAAVVACALLVLGLLGRAGGGGAVDPHNGGSAIEGADANATTVSSPRVVPDASMESGQVVTWDCVWFGSYPQGEVAEGDPVRESLETAKWDASGDATLGGTRYRRISGDDATNSDDWPEDARKWRYFRYEPIKWRVLEASGDAALVLSDVALDARQYNAKVADVTWETSSVRSWLNGYGADSNQPVIDFSGSGFADAAFSAGQRAAVLDTRVVNADSQRYGTDGGGDTVDRVFLLSEADVDGVGAEAYGFAAIGGDLNEARRCRASDYASAMGAVRSTDGGLENNCCWWLRSPGYSQYCAAHVHYDGYVDRYGNYVSRYGNYVSRGSIAVRPALNLNLSSPEISYAGTVSSDGTVTEVTTRPCSRTPLPQTASPQRDRGQN